MLRIIAVIILFIPGVIGAFGIKLMRDALFSDFYPIFIHIGIQFVIGFIMFIGGLAFIGGFLYNRDKKKNLLNNAQYLNKKAKENNEEDKEMKVAKVGGSSLANAEQFKKVSDIIKADDERKFIVVSAPGKRHDEDFKVTDLLIQLVEAYLKNDKYQSYLISITDRFKTIINDLNLDMGLIETIENNIINTLESDISDRLKLNSIKAIGEDTSALILSAYLNSLDVSARYVNPKDAGIIVEDLDSGAQILDESYDIIYQLTYEEDIIIIPGFFGYTSDGDLATFSRGGSDITGSIIASGVNASLYENFTDVDSVYSVNPNIVDNPKPITTLTYREMRELAYAGFSVFHDEALIPAVEKEIPVCIKNTNNPSAPGTMIVANKDTPDKTVVGVASDTGFISIYVSKF